MAGQPYFYRAKFWFIYSYWKFVWNWLAG